MNFNKHSHLAGAHARLSASKYHWIRYDEEKLERVFMAELAAQRGTELHDLAHKLIRLKVNLERTTATLNQYVNDAIGFKMESEQVLFYSPLCYGTADCISFRDYMLRIHDLKTGYSKASMDQLKIYAALFCLEYNFRPFELETELRIYQNDAIDILVPDPVEISQIMEQIKFFNKRLSALMEEAQS